MAATFRHICGGIGGLYRLLAEHGEAIEADLHRFYGVRLRKALYGARSERLSARELLVRIRYLPRESALSYELNGPSRDVTVADHLLARIETRLAGANWQRGGGKGQRPKPVKLPTAEDQQRRRSYMGRLRRLGLIPDVG